MYSIFLFLHCKNVCESLLKLIDWLIGNMSLTLVYFSLLLFLITILKFTKHNSTNITYNAGLITMLYLQNNILMLAECSTEYSYLQKIQLPTLQATYTAEKRILFVYFIVLAEYKVTYNTLYEILTV